MRSNKNLKILFEVFFLLAVFGISVFFRLGPRLEQDPHLLTFEADIWYRLTMAQYLVDHHTLAPQDIRYEAYGHVPFWYPPLGLYAFQGLTKITGWDLPTVCSRVMPVLEALVPLSMYLLCRFLFGISVALFSTLFLALTPSFIFWSGISDPQSFILFMIPLILLLWIKHIQWSLTSNKYRLWRLFLLGALLSLCFFTHLFYFLLVGILIVVTLGIKKENGKGVWLDLAGIFCLSQLLTVWWWAPKNLYWWWLKALVTSSGLYIAPQQFLNFGMAAAFIGLFCLAAIFFTALFYRKKAHPLIWLPLGWALIPLLETQNETLLSLVGQLHLSWETFFKPLEGFRFFCFLAQPLALCFGLVAAFLSHLFIKKWPRLKPFLFILLPSVFILMLADLQWKYCLKDRFQNAGVTLEEIQAAQWFRENSQPKDRIIADYYRGQMLGGICGGKSLLGLAFPLRNTSIPYINLNDFTVAPDVFQIFTTSNPEEAAQLMQRYHATHLFYSTNMNETANFCTDQQDGFGFKENLLTLIDSPFFEVVYDDFDSVVILKRTQEELAQLN